MDKRPGLELLKTFVPLILFSVLLYASFHYIDTKPLTAKTVFLALFAVLSLFYVVNFRLVNIGSRRGVFALLVIMLIALILKVYTLWTQKNAFHLLTGYGILIIGLLGTSLVFYFKHLKMRILEAIELHVDKDEYVLNENVNYNVEINPVSSITIDKIEISLVLTENAQVSHGKVLDKIIYEDTKVISSGETFKQEHFLRGVLLIPPSKMSTFYGHYNAIFWYVKLVVFVGTKPYDISRIIDVKPEILLRQED